MAAKLKDHDDHQWSQPVSNAGLKKLMEAIEKPKAPNEALRRLMAKSVSSKQVSKAK